MNIEINVQSASLKATNVESYQVSQIIEGFFGTLGYTQLAKDHAYAGCHAKTTSTSKTDGVDKKSKVPVAVVSSKPDAVTEHKQGIEKVLPKINDDRTLHVPLAELATLKEFAPQEHWESGIKVSDDGTERYRCHYSCECGNKGKRYIMKDSEYVHCHECNEKLFVEPATPNFQESGLPERDSFGNFYIAREPWELGDAE